MLTEPQQRTLEIALRLVETELARLEALLDWTYTGSMVSVVQDLGDLKRQKFQAQIQEARELIRGLRDTLGLRPEEIAKSSWVAGKLARLWVVAEECQSRYLRGYGEVAPRLPGLLDPAARRLAWLLLEMQRGVRKERAGEPVGGSSG